MRVLLCFFIFVAVVCVGLSPQFSKAVLKPGDAGAVVQTAAPARKPVMEAASTGRTVRLEGDSRGHFQVDARIEGRSIDLMVDTGASLVVLNEKSAARLGIFPKPSEYTGRSQTANGVSKFAPVRLNR